MLNKRIKEKRIEIESKKKIEREQREEEKRRMILSRVDKSVKSRSGVYDSKIESSNVHLSNVLQ